MARNIVVSIVLVALATWLGMVVHSDVLMVQVYVWQASHGAQDVQLGQQILYGLVRCLTHPGLFALSQEHPTWSGAMHIAYLLIAYGPISMLWVSPNRAFRYVPAALALVILVLIGIDVARLLNPMSTFMVRLLVVVAVTGVGVLLGRLRLKLIGDGNVVASKRPSTAMRGKKYKLGFTLVEVLVVLAILLVLAAIVMSVYGRSRKSACVTREINQVRQVYIAVNLYEADFDSESPPMLASLDGAYIQSKYLTCPTDERLKLKLPNWPSNPWINIAIVDPPELRDARSATINSYFYLKTFAARFAKGHTYEEYRSSPELGLIAGVGLLRCGTCKTGTCVGNCEYWSRAGVPSSEGHPPVNMSGDIVIARTDGSIYVRKRPEGCPSMTLSHMQLFLDGDLGCDRPVGL